MLGSLEPKGLLHACADLRAPEDLVALDLEFVSCIHALRRGDLPGAQMPSLVDESFVRLRALLEHPWWESGLLGFCALECLQPAVVYDVLSHLQLTTGTVDERLSRCVAALRLIQLSEHHRKQTVLGIDALEQSWLQHVRLALAGEFLSPGLLSIELRDALDGIAASGALHRRRLISTARGCDEQGLPAGDPIPPLAVFDRADRWRQGLANLRPLVADFDGRATHFGRFEVSRMQRWNVLRTALEVGAAQSTGQGTRAAAELKSHWRE